MFRPRTLSQYPWVVVRLDCVLCQRKGCYRLARLAARYGPEQSLEGLLADLAHDCPWWRSNPRKYEPRCGACFVDLERSLPPPDEPQAPVQRTRPPAREDVPKRRVLVAVARGGTPMLSGWPLKLITIVCDRCDRHEDHVVDVLLQNGDARLTDLRLSLTADCSRIGNPSVYEQCQARFLMPE